MLIIDLLAFYGNQSTRANKVNIANEYIRFRRERVIV